MGFSQVFTIYLFLLFLHLFYSCTSLPPLMGCKGNIYDMATQMACGSYPFSPYRGERCCNGVIWHVYNETCCWDGAKLTVVPSAGACIATISA